MKLNFLRANIKQANSVTKALLVVLLAIFALMPQASQVFASGSLTTVKDTLTNSRPSEATALSVATSSATTITVTSTLGLVQGDTITLCDTSACAITETKIIASVPNMTQINLSSGLTNTYASGGFVYLKSTSKHTLTFTTRSVVSGGKFVVTMPGDSTPNDSLPGSAGFEFNKITTGDISLAGGTAGTIATSTSGSNLVFTVPFTGSIASGTAITITIGNTTLLQNPTKTAATGTADTFNVQIDEQDSSSNIVDTTTVKVATIEAVTVTATVDPSLTFTVNPVASGASVAGVTTDAASTASTVPFGILQLSTNRTVAQFLHVDTNASNGYIVTAQSDGSLRKTNGTVISDYSTTAADNNATNGFGYSLQDKTNTPSVFHYNDSGTFYSKGFSSSTPTTVMSNSAPASGDESYVIYRVRVGSLQPQGNYQALITYIATASF